MDRRGKKLFKLLDRYIGIPILLALSLFKRKNEQPESIGVIGILTVPALGDIILLNGLLRDIKDYNPNIRIILFISNEVREIAEVMNSCDELVNIELYNPFSAIKTLRKYPVDIFIDSSQWARLNAILTCFSKSKYKIGFNTPKQYKHFIFDFTADHSESIHELYNYKKLVFNPGIATNNLPSLVMEENKSVKNNRVVVHIMPSGYLSRLKRWPDNNWKVIVEYLLENDMEIYFTGSASDRKYIELLLNNYRNELKIFNVAGKYTIRETASLLSSSKIVISVNTGIMHLASALGCNLIALHGPTNPKRWGPLNSNAVVIQSNYPEAPCLNLGFEYNCTDRTGECMKKIYPEVVIAEIKKIINNTSVNA